MTVNFQQWTNLINMNSELFKLQLKDKGKTFNINPISSPNDNDDILSYTVVFDNDKKTRRTFNLCFVICDGELRIFQFGYRFKNILSDDMFSIYSTKTIDITVNTVQDTYAGGLLAPSYKIIENDNRKRFEIEHKLHMELFNNISLESVYNEELKFYSLRGYDVIRNINEVQFKTLEEFNTI